MSNENPLFNIDDYRGLSVEEIGKEISARLRATGGATYLYQTRLRFADALESPYNKADFEDAVEWLTSYKQTTLAAAHQVDAITKLAELIKELLEEDYPSEDESNENGEPDTGETNEDDPNEDDPNEVDPNEVDPNEDDDELNGVTSQPFSGEGQEVTEEILEQFPEYADIISIGDTIFIEGGKVTAYLIGEELTVIDDNIDE